MGRVRYGNVRYAILVASLASTLLAACDRDAPERATVAPEIAPPVPETDGPAMTWLMALGHDLDVAIQRTHLGAITCRRAMVTRAIACLDERLPPLDEAIAAVGTALDMGRIPAPFEDEARRMITRESATACELHREADILRAHPEVIRAAGEHTSESAALAGVEVAPELTREARGCETPDETPVEPMGLQWMRTRYSCPGESGHGFQCCTFDAATALYAFNRASLAGFGSGRACREP